MITCSKLMILAGAAALTSPLRASTPGSWAQVNQRANRACVAMSGLARPQLLGARISYSDAIPVEARMIRGFDKRGQFKRLICLFDRRTSRTEVQEAPSWNAPAVNP